MQEDQLKDCFGNPMKIIDHKDRDQGDFKRIILLFKPEIASDVKQDIINRYHLSDQINENYNFKSYHTDYSIEMALFELNSFKSNLFDHQVYADVLYYANRGF